MGDAMREMDDKSLIRSDFILVYGDIVSNLDLKTVVQEHKYVYCTRNCGRYTYNYISFN